MSVRLEDSRALLTGATGGIGNAIARELHARGAHVLLTGRRTELLDRLKSDLGERVEVIPADLADGTELARLVEQASPISVLIANAALPGTGRLDGFTPEQIDRVLDVNLRAPIQLVREL